MVLLKYPSLELVEYKVARIATTMPYIRGFLSFREYPALLAAWEMLSQKPDLVFVDGHGSRILAVLVSPAILAYWWMCQR